MSTSSKSPETVADALGAIASTEAIMKMSASGECDGAGK